MEGRGFQAWSVHGKSSLPFPLSLFLGGGTAGRPVISTWTDKRNSFKGGSSCSAYVWAQVTFKGVDWCACYLNTAAAFTRVVESAMPHCALKTN